MIPSALLLPNCSDAFFQKINGFFQKKMAYFRRNQLFQKKNACGMSLVEPRPRPK
jgi:hypothetical protein